MEINVFEIYREHPHFLTERSSYGLGSLHPEPFCGQGVQEFEIYSGLKSPVFGNQKNFCCRSLGIDAVGLFPEHPCAPSLKLCINLRMSAVQVELGL